MSNKSSKYNDDESLDSDIDITEITKVKQTISTDKKTAKNFQPVKININSTDHSTIKKSDKKSTLKSTTKNIAIQKQNVTFADTKIKNSNSNVQKASINVQNSRIKSINKAGSTQQERVDLLGSKSDSSIAVINEISNDKKKPISVKNASANYNVIKNDKKLGAKNVKQKQALSSSNQDVSLNPKVSSHVTKEYTRDDIDVKKEVNTKKLNSNPFPNYKKDNETLKINDTKKETNTKKVSSKLPLKNNKKENHRPDSFVHLNSKTKFTKKFLFILNKCFEMGHKGLLFYLFYEYLVNLFLKHFFYLISSLDIYLNAEYILICMYGLCQCFIILFVYYKMFINHEHLKLIHVLFLSAQFSMLVLLGGVQFVFGMNVWDHKYRLLYCFNSELVKFVLLLFWLIMIGVFKFFNYYLKTDSIFCFKIDGHVISE
jgi:hypothetical protein